MSRSGPGRGTEVGRYLVVDALGAGAMGEVFSAYDPELDRKVALKLVKFGSHEDVDKARIRLLREAQALAKLSHPNVVAVHDAGTLGDRVFIAMEYVDGQTFRRWLNDRQERDPNATWREALALLLQAGRGLAAAHEAGLVHRDFKPANVMVSSDGRVRVLDFGLARRFGETDAEAPPPPAVSANDLTVSLSGTRSSLALQLTQTGMVMGTPAYMAPEQFFGGEIDARTDQFSFCVVLYRALLGVRPFLGDDYDQLARAVGSHELRETPRTSTVPRAIVAVLRQGLAASPERRFRSMDALLDALTRATSRGRRRLMFAAGTAAALAGAAGLFLSDRAPAAFTPCLGAEAKLTGVWDEATRQHVADAFETTALPFAADARAETTRSLDRWAEQWVESHAQTCEATRVRGDQSEALMDLRIGCLDRRLQDLAAVTDVLVHADAQVVENAAQGVQQLAPPSECVGVERDDDGLLIPHDPELVGQVEQVRNRLAAGRAYLLAGKFEQAREEAAAGLERARALGYQPTIAEAAFALAHVHERLMVLDPALALYEEALFAAAASNHARIEARSLIGMLSLLGMHKGETEAALRYGRHAEAVNQRLGNPAELAATLALYRGNARSQANELVDAITDMEQAVL
ncbi:MAG: serine/threonine protein kinase, partial [Deltaproteobacteria bacterium]|nr:serine/threonine protein kinase [Deltaproteobacteria bacterium]